MRGSLPLGALVLSLLVLMAGGIPAAALDGFISADVHFEIAQTDLIPGVAAVRASCNVTASGEPLALRANETARTTIGAAPGPCSIVLVLFGLDVGLPLVNTTPLGRSSFFIPGIATATFGLVDVTLDLVTSLNSTTRVEDPRLATVDPTDVAWSAWGIALLDVQAADGFGSNATSALNTTFVYTMALAVSVFALSVEIFHADLTAIGSVIGTPSLRTDLSVDLRPHALVLGPLSEVRHDGATFAWAGSVDPDVDHLELFVTDGTRNASYRLGPAASTVSVPLVPSTHYTAWIVAVDGSGQATPSNVIVFDTPGAPPTVPNVPLETQGTPALFWVLVVVAGLLGAIGYGLGLLRGRREE